MQAQVAYHTQIITVNENSPFTDIDFVFPAHFKACVGLMIECSLNHSDFPEGQMIGLLALEFMGKSVNYHQPVRRCLTPTRYTHALDFMPLNVELLPNLFTQGHYTNNAFTETVEVIDGKTVTTTEYQSYTLNITFKMLTDE